MVRKRKPLVGLVRYCDNRNDERIFQAHNSHVGDARATESNQTQKINIGQLIGERFGLENTYNIAFTTFTGTVTAADNWDMNGEFKRIRPALSESIESLFHQARLNHDQYFLLFRSNNPSIELSQDLYDQLNEKRIERAIGVIYRPQTERQSPHNSIVLFIWTLLEL